MALSELVGNEIMDYSERVAGVPGNHGKAVSFDVTDGYVGINQFDGEQLTDRVLLSPGQMRALYAFLKRAREHRRNIR